MKALTLWEPWATAIALGLKKIETRSWGTSYRGPIAIHAARSNEGEYFFEELGEADRAVFIAAGYKTWRQLPFGHVVATARLVDCRTTNSLCFSEKPCVDAREYCWGNFEEGRFGWILEEVRRTEKPVPARGFQQLWEWRVEGLDAHCESGCPDPVAGYTSDDVPLCAKCLAEARKERAA